MPISAKQLRNRAGMYRRWERYKNFKRALRRSRSEDAFTNGWDAEFRSLFRSTQDQALEGHDDHCDRENGFPCDCYRSWGFPFETVGDVSGGAVVRDVRVRDREPVALDPAREAATAC
mgnify:FL=1